jgi:hypothetical protein
MLKSYRAKPGITPRGAELLDAALAGVPAAKDQLATLEGRQAARARFVPADQLRNAYEFATTRVEMAAVRGSKEDRQRAASELHELTPASRSFKKPVG